MPIKATLLTVLIGAAIAAPWNASHAQQYARSDAAQALPSTSSPADVPEGRAIDTLVMRPSAGSPTDIVGGRGPNPHARELRDIAIYEAIGNRDGAEILTSQLKEFGVTRQTIQRSIDRTNVHAGVSRANHGPAAEIEAGWEASQ